MLITIFHPFLFLLVSPLISVIAGEEAQVEAGKDVKEASIGKNKGEQLATQTNSELISSSQQIKHTSSGANQCTTDGSKCLTCRSVGMCKGGVMTEVQCRGLYPYCDPRTGSCTSERRKCMEDEKEKTINCPAEGFYPDPQTCRAFRVCEGLNSYKFACSTLQVYNHEEKKCTRPSLRVRCASFACFGKQGRYTPYSADRSLYTLCADGAGTDIFKCPENQEFDETKQKCIPSCQTEDSIPDTDDDQCRKYYKCVKSSILRRIDAVPATCPTNQIFDIKQLKCIQTPSSFICTHSSIDTTQSPIDTTQSSIDATQSTTPAVAKINEETYFMNSPHEKSAPIIGSVHKKEEEKEAVLPPKATTLTTQDSVAAVISQLNADTHKVVRETITTASAGTTSDATEKSQTTGHKLSSEDNAKLDLTTKLPQSTNEHTHHKLPENSATHKPFISGQTYKITTTEPTKFLTPSTTNGPSSLPTKEVEPNQMFNIKDDILDKIDIKSNSPSTLFTSTTGKPSEETTRKAINYFG